MPEYWGGDIKWVTPAELRNEINTVFDTAKHLTKAGFESASLRMMPAGTILLTTRAPIGKLALAGDEMCCNQGFKCLICPETVNNEWLCRLLKHRVPELQAMGTGATFKELSKRAISDYKICVPPMEAQIDIVKKLTKLDEVLANCRALLSALDDLVKSQFVKMFGGYGADSEYRCARLGKLLSVEPQNGLYKPQRYYRTDCGGTPIVRVDAFSDGSVFSYASLKRLDCSESELENYALHEGDIVMNRVNGSIERVGKVALIKGLDEATVYESNMMRFHVDESRLNATYIVHVLCSDDIRKQIKSCARIANQCSVNQENIAELQIPLPPLALQQQFADFVARVDKLGFEVKRLHNVQKCLRCLIYTFPDLVFTANFSLFPQHLTIDSPIFFAYSQLFFNLLLCINTSSNRINNLLFKIWLSSRPTLNRIDSFH